MNTKKQTPIKLYAPAYVRAGELQYTEKEKQAAVIMDQLCPVFIDKTDAHISPETFKALVLRLAEIL